MASSGEQNWIFSDSVLHNTASRNDGITYEKEMDLRSKTVWFMEDLARELPRPIPRKVVSCAAVFFHRFYTFHSLKLYARFTTAVACLFLAAKAEDWPCCKLRDIVNTYYILRRASPSEAEAKEMHKQVLISERILLCSLNFNLNINYPYSFITTKLKEFKNYLSFMQKDDKDLIVQMCINFVNDSYRTILCLRYGPEKIAMGAILLAMIKMSIRPASSDQTWFELLERDVDETSLKNIVNTMVDMYGEDKSAGDVKSLKSKVLESTRMTQLSGKRKLSDAEGGGGGGDDDAAYYKASKVMVGSSEGSSGGSSGGSSNGSTVAIPKHERGLSVNFPTSDTASSDQELTNDDEEWTERKPLSRKVTYKGSTLEQSEYFEKISASQKVGLSSSHATPSESPNGSSSGSHVSVSSNDVMSSASSTPAFIAPPADSPPGDHFDSMREGTGFGSNSGTDTPASMMYDDATPVHIPPPPSDTPEFPSLPPTPIIASHAGQSSAYCLTR